MDFSAIAKHSEQRIADKILVGCSTDVHINGESVWSSCHGYADIDAGIKVDDNSVFRLASMTKPITGVAVMQLVENGKVGLEDKITKYLPEFNDFSIGAFDENRNIKSVRKASRPFTVYDILTHSSGFIQGDIGFTYWGSHAEIRPAEGDTLATALPKLKNVPMDADPGTAIGYGAHSTFDLLGLIVEMATGMKYSEYLQKNIFDPLGMVDTTFHPTDAQRARAVMVYTADGTIHPAPGREVHQAMYGFPETYEGGSCGLYSTKADYIRFAECLLNRGTLDGVRILKPETVDYMGTTQTKPNMAGYNPVQNWGISMRVIQSHDPACVLPYGTYGWSGAYGTHFIVCPEYNLTAVYMSNMMNGGGSGAPTAFEFERDIMDQVKK